MGTGVVVVFPVNCALQHSLWTVQKLEKVVNPAALFATYWGFPTKTPACSPYILQDWPKIVFPGCK